MIYACVDMDKLERYKSEPSGEGLTIGAVSEAEAVKGVEDEVLPVPNDLPAMYERKSIPCREPLAIHEKCCHWVRYPSRNQSVFPVCAAFESESMNDVALEDKWTRWALVEVCQKNQSRWFHDGFTRQWRHR